MSCHGVIFMQHWSKVDTRVGEPSPVQRRAHAAVCLNYGEDQPQIFMFGGEAYSILSDGWILNVQSGRWREVSSLLTCCTVVCDTFHALVWISFQVQQNLSIQTTHYSGTSNKGPSGKGTTPLQRTLFYVHQMLTSAFYKGQNCWLRCVL